MAGSHASTDASRGITTPIMVRTKEDKRPSVLLAVVVLLAAAVAGEGRAAVRAPVGARATMRQGDALSRLVRDRAGIGKKAPASFAGGEVAFEAAAAAAVGVAKILPQQGLKERDKIEELPGQPRCVGFDQYGGYVTVDEKAGRALFYYFVEAPGDAASKPLVLWLNGGPGCSSLGYGAMEELGPFRVGSDGKTLFENPYAWNKVANVLFLESPAGVGYSYSNTTTDYDVSGDGRTAEDAYVFLVNWLERFPEYKSRDFYITGESYAGHYVPQLAHAILRHRRHLRARRGGAAVINLKGIAIGNAVINDPTDNKGMYDFFWTHALISDETHGALVKSCNFTAGEVNGGESCQAALDESQRVFGEVDVYNIYGPLCLDGNLTSVPREYSINNFDPCSDFHVNHYLNDPEVQKALHANVTKLGHDWEHCSDLLTWQDYAETVLPLLREFMKNGLRILVYSGDTDGRVPVTGSRYSVNALNLPVKTSWKPWAAAGEVAGYSEVYEGGLTLATVRGAGHEVPSYQARRSLVLIAAFLEGEPLPPYPI